jgi:hypothetical protein
MQTLGFLLVVLLAAESSSLQAFAWTTPRSTLHHHRVTGCPTFPRATRATASSSSSSSTTQLNAGFFQNLFNKNEVKRAEAETPQYDPITISPDFRVAGAFLAAGILLDFIPYIQLTLDPIVTLLGLLFLFQAFRIRFRFTEQNELELVTLANVFTGKIESSGENLVVGGANLWACDTIVNYEFFPAIGSSPVGPVLVYFKETQTNSETWTDGPGALADKPEKIARGEAAAGQAHFFPAVCSSEQLRDEFVKRQIKKCN